MNYICFAENMNEEFFKLELFLNSLYDHSYSCQELSLLATNGHLDIKYIKNKDKHYMTIVKISLKAPQEKYKLKFIDKKFEINYENYKSLNEDFFDLSELQI